MRFFGQLTYSARSNNMKGQIMTTSNIVLSTATLDAFKHAENETVNSVKLVREAIRQASSEGLQWWHFLSPDSKEFTENPNLEEEGLRNTLAMYRNVQSWVAQILFNTEELQPALKLWGMTKPQREKLKSAKAFVKNVEGDLVEKNATQIDNMVSRKVAGYSKMMWNHEDKEYQAKLDTDRVDAMAELSGVIKDSKKLKEAILAKHPDIRKTKAPTSHEKFIHDKLSDCFNRLNGDKMLDSKYGDLPKANEIKLSIKKIIDTYFI